MCSGFSQRVCNLSLVLCRSAQGPVSADGELSAHALSNSIAQSVNFGTGSTIQQGLSSDDHDSKVMHCFWQLFALSSFKFEKLLVLAEFARPCVPMFSHTLRTSIQCHAPRSGAIYMHLRVPCTAFVMLGNGIFILAQ